MPDEKERDENEAWDYVNYQCVSLIRKNGTTLDLVIRNEQSLMVFINAVQQALYKPSEQKNLRLFGLMRLRMFLSFASWRRRTKISTMLMQAIIRTLVDKITLILANIQQALPRKDDDSSLLSQDQIRSAIKSTKSQAQIAGVSEIPEDI